MRSFKNIFYLIFLVGFVFIAPLKSNALTIDEVIQSANSLQPINITDIKSKINYDYNDKIDEISSILDESLNSSKNANDKLKELNTLMISINEDNEALLTIKDKNEYDESVSTLKEKVEVAKQLNTNAKTLSENGLDKYNEALVKYATLKSELEEAKEKTESLLNFNIGKVNTKLEIINNLLEELNKEEEKLKEAYDEANIAYENAKENANVANNNFSEKLEELREYVEVNGEQELNELIEANTKYLTSGLLYATSQVALKLIDIEIELIEAEITSLEADLDSLDAILKSIKDEIDLKETELTALKNELKILNENLENVEKLKKQLEDANDILDDLIKTQNNIPAVQAQCSVYIGALNTAIENNDAKTVIELLFKNEPQYGFVGKDITVATESKFNSNFEWVNYIFVKDNSEPNKEYVYSYENNNGNITIYKQIFVPTQDVTVLNGSLAVGRYVAHLNDGTTKNIINVNINETYEVLGRPFSINANINGFIKNESGNIFETEYYDVIRENNSWVAVEKNIALTYGNWSIPNGLQLVNGNNKIILTKVTETEHYEQGDSFSITSQAAANRCNNALGKPEDIANAILEQQEIIANLEEQIANANEESLKNQIEEKTNAIVSKENEIKTAKADYENKKATLTNEKGMTYSEIEERLTELNKKLNQISISEGIDIDDLFADVKDGKMDVRDVLETINNLNVGLKIKRMLIESLDKLLADNYNKAKQDLINVAGEDLENISNILKDISPLVNEVAESNLKLLEEKVKLELAKENYESLLKVKELVVETKEDTLAELETLEKLKEENNFDLSYLDVKFEKAKEALINENSEVEIKINDYKVINEENTKFENNTTNIENIKFENNSSDEEANTTEDEEKQNNLVNKDEEKEKGFNWLNLLWLLPIALIIFFIIIIIKRKKEEKNKIN